MTFAVLRYWTTVLHHNHGAERRRIVRSFKAKKGEDRLGWLFYRAESIFLGRALWYSQVLQSVHNVNDGEMERWKIPLLSNGESFIHT